MKTRRKTLKICRNTLLIVAGMVLGGCSSTPKVIADVTEQLSSLPVDRVMVYETEDSVPTTARPIGKVKVTDGGLTPTYSCLYSNMLSLAVSKTAESGGNALHIDKHKTPNFASSCHRIWGTMYLMPDTMANGNALSAISQMEEKYDKELLAIAQNHIQRREKMLDNPKDIVKVNIGPSWITSEIQTYYKTYKNETGVGFGIDYQHLWRSGIGFGINYMYHYTSFENDFSANMHYIGPSLVGSIKLGSNWRMDAALGLGYSVYREDYKWAGGESESNVGSMVQLGIEYMLSKHIGLGLQFNTMTMRMKRPNDIDTKEYDFYGIKRLDAQLGMRFYL